MAKSSEGMYNIIPRLKTIQNDKSVFNPLGRKSQLMGNLNLEFLILKFNTQTPKLESKIQGVMKEFFKENKPCNLQF